jgi:hypothetical protein
MPFTPEELAKMDEDLKPFEGKITEQWAKRGRQKQRVIDPRAKPSQAEIRRMHAADLKIAAHWKNWEPK